MAFLEARRFCPASGGMLAGWKYSNFKDGSMAELFHVNDADMNLALLPEGMSLESAVMLTDIVTTGSMVRKMLIFNWRYCSGGRY